MDFIICIVLFAAGMFFFAVITKKFGYRIGVGMARKHLKDLYSSDDEPKDEAHE